MRFQNMTNIAAISDAAIVANRLLSGGSRMHLDLHGKDDWKYPKGIRGIDVSFDLAMRYEPVWLLTYRPWNPFTKAIAMTNGDGAIHFNIYKVDKTTLESKVGTILHEYAHLCGFKHGNNYKTKEKCLYSVPYFLSENVGKWL